MQCRATQNRNAMATGTATEVHHVRADAADVLDLPLVSRVMSIMLAVAVAVATATMMLALSTGDDRCSMNMMMHLGLLVRFAVVISVRGQFCKKKKRKRRSRPRRPAQGRYNDGGRRREGEGGDESTITILR